MNIEYKIAILGSPNAILGFKALGVKTFPVLTVEDAKKSIEEVKNNNYGIFLITEDWGQKLKKELKELIQQTLPAVTFIPSQHGSIGFADKNLKEIIERAVGSDILSKK